MQAEPKAGTWCPACSRHEPLLKTKCYFTYAPNAYAKLLRLLEENPGEKELTLQDVDGQGLLVEAMGAHELFPVDTPHMDIKAEKAALLKMAYVLCINEIIS